MCFIGCLHVWRRETFVPISVIKTQIAVTNLTLWKGLCTEKLIFSYLVKKFPPFYGNRSVVTVFTKKMPPCVYPYSQREYDGWHAVSLQRKFLVLIFLSFYRTKMLTSWDQSANLIALHTCKIANFWLFQSTHEDILQLYLFKFYNQHYSISVPRYSELSLGQLISFLY
jgi:hypothetical protein